ncbi:leucine-rich melanocyte differentiation-associated protein-like [Amphiura filiformis]|uniref:leucine-rich melanocyte differentiation-associated protein-like n=1 Tax=Amphiura filiformis TaxID=82378 RepID=UPI003B225475
MIAKQLHVKSRQKVNKKFCVRVLYCSRMDGGEGTDNGQGMGPILEGSQLAYIEHGCASIPQELGQWYGSKVTRLDLSFNCIRSLEGLDRFTLLEELVLDNNDIDDSIQFPQMPKLHTLQINKNKISNIDSFTDKLKANCPSLTYLSMLGNQACPNELLSLDKDEEDYQRYRYYVIFKLEKLRFLDSRPVKESERNEAKRVGSYMRVVKADETDMGVPNSSDTSAEKYNPLPEDTKDGGQHQGTFGRCRYVYYGRHSEGNRFIRNSDL